LKVCVTASEKSLDAQLDPRFGRCKYFIIIDPETLQFEAIDNTATAAMHGAGIQASQIVIEKGVETILTGNVGPNAYQVLSTAGIKIITGARGTIKEVIEKYKKGEFQITTNSTVPPHFGGGTGRSMGFGRGMGFGQGMGRGLRSKQSMGIGVQPSQTFRQLQPQYPSQDNTLQKPEEEMATLEEYKKKLEENLESLKARIKKIKDSIESNSQKK
jgi:predicted Fe-Mo cluster-binding NifX family protein